MQALTFRTRYVLTHVQHAARGGDNARGTLALDCHITTVTHGGRSHVLMTQETRRHESCSGRGSATRLDETREDGRSDVASRDRGVDPTRSGRCAFLDANSNTTARGTRLAKTGERASALHLFPGDRRSARISIAYGCTYRAPHTPPPGRSPSWGLKKHSRPMARLNKPGTLRSGLRASSEHPFSRRAVL